MNNSRHPYGHATFQVMWTDHKGNEHELDVNVYANVTPGDPGRLSGPPELCYPPADAEVEDLEFDFDTIPAALDAYIYERITQDAARRAEDARDDAEEARAEARRDV